MRLSRVAKEISLPSSFLIQHTHTVTITAGAQNGSATFVQWMLALTALLSALGTFIGIAAQVRSASRQIRASVVSANRQKWIDSVRDEVATILSYVWAHGRLSHSGIEPPEGQTPYELEDISRASLYKLRVLLNANDAQHRDLLRYVQLIVDRMACDDEVEGLIATAVQRLVDAEMMKMREGR